jgi:hypothetical protein
MIFEDQITTPNIPWFEYRNGKLSDEPDIINLGDLMTKLAEGARALSLTELGADNFKYGTFLEVYHNGFGAGLRALNETTHIFLVE